VADAQGVIKADRRPHRPRHSHKLASLPTLGPNRKTVKRCSKKKSLMCMRCNTCKWVKSLHIQRCGQGRARCAQAQPGLPSTPGRNFPCEMGSGFEWLRMGRDGAWTDSAVRRRGSLGALLLGK
jgi:hypothetical protein